MDEDVDVQNFSEVAWKALNNIDPERDIQFVMGPIDSLDHASRLPNYGSKMGVDATRKWPEEGLAHRGRAVMRMPEDVQKRVDALWKKAGIKVAGGGGGAPPPHRRYQRPVGAPQIVVNPRDSCLVVLGEEKNKVRTIQ